MENFEFVNPTRVIFGNGAAARIGEQVRKHGHRLILMIGGGGSARKNGVYDTVAASLRQSGIRWNECWGVRPNPVLSKTNEMIAAARKAGVDAILAAGGGSVLDTAKTVAAGYYVDDVWTYFESREPVTRALPVYAVLTLSATGSEMNSFAVITKEDEKKKWPLYGPALFPRVSIVDPSVQMALPWAQTVNGAIDAMSHIQEFYFLAKDAETTLAICEALLRSVISSTDRLQIDPADYNARASLAWAATLALNGLAGAGAGDGDWATHGMAHGLSAVCPHAAHGAGLGVIFPAWILYCQDANPDTFRRWARNVWGQDSVEDGVAAWRAKIKSWGAATTLSNLGVKENQIDEIAASGYATQMSGAVKQLSAEDFKRILRSVWQ